MSLYHVQDSDRPMWVVAESYSQAVSLWQQLVKHENDGADPGEPLGVALVCEGDELLLTEFSVAEATGSSLNEAAPQVLAKLKEIVKHFREGGRPYVADWLPGAEAAIAKAEGQPTP